jgi:hypothetical protein
MTEDTNQRELTEEERFVVGLRDAAVERQQQQNRRALPPDDERVPFEPTDEDGPRCG